MVQNSACISFINSTDDDNRIDVIAFEAVLKFRLDFSYRICKAPAVFGLVPWVNILSLDGVLLLSPLPVRIVLQHIYTTQYILQVTKYNFFLFFFLQHVCPQEKKN